MTEENVNIIPEEFEEDEAIVDEEFDDDDDLFEETAEPMIDPTQVITLRTSGGDSRYIPADEPMALSQVKGLSGLTFGSVAFYMNAAVIDDATVIPVGATVTAVGNVKGG
jgi:hypothetical protein